MLYWQTFFQWINKLKAENMNNVDPNTTLPPSLPSLHPHWLLCSAHFQAVASFQTGISCSQQMFVDRDARSTFSGLTWYQYLNLYLSISEFLKNSFKSLRGNKISLKEIESLCWKSPVSKPLKSSPVLALATARVWSVVPGHLVVSPTGEYRGWKQTDLYFSVSYCITNSCDVRWNSPAIFGLVQIIC